MDKVLKFYKLDNGEEKSFPNEVEQIVTSDFTYTAQRMGGAPTITCTVRHSYALDTDEKVDYMLWSDMVYAEFNGEKYYLLRTPTCTYDNTDRRYKYDVEMVSERVILDNVYLFDVAQMVDGERPDAADRYRGVTNSTKIPFYGDINDFATLLNNSLAFSGLYDAKTGKGYHVVVDDGVVSESHSIEFSDQFFSNALQESYNTFEIPYYFVGKVIHIGTAPDDAKIGSALSYGSDNALLSISKQNANSKLINRITGTGDTRNLPYYYPNETPKGQVDVYVPDSNKVIQTNDIQIDNKSLAYSTTELNNPVVFKKYMPNELTEEISKITYFHSVHGVKPYEEYEIELNWYGDFYPRGIQPYTWIPIAFDTANKGRYTFKYHVYAKFSTTRDEGGLIRWVWNANPRYPLIEEQQGQPSPWTSKGKVGKINYAVFENLKVYEERATGQVSQEASVQGAYPSLYIDTPFQGTPNAKGGRDVILHMEFDMWKHAVDLRVGSDYAPLVDDFNYINFASISLLKTSDVKYVWSTGKKEVEDIKDLGYSLSTRITDILSDASRKDSIVGESFGLKQISYITPSTNLMPSIYRESLGAERFYEAENNKYELGDGYYHFNNPYVDGKPKEHIENFDDIYPSIKGMVNKDKVPMDRFIEFAYDEGDNDETNPNNDNKLYHPLFYAKLPKLNGDFGFNLFDYASESGAMQITMTSGQCGACTFEIAVDEQTQKNTVQVDENGNLVYNADGKVALGSPQDKQNDTVNNEVWIALRKDINTYPSTMPNVGEHNKPKANEDTFVILNINMPQSYIRAAEKRLDDALIYYMSQHNDEKFNFGIKFSRIYLEEHPEVLSKISENSSVTIDYNNQTPTLYISSFTYRMQPSAILPEITVELVDKLTVHRNVIENTVSQIKGEILERIASIDFLRQGVRHFVRKDVDDTVNGRLRLNKGFESSDDASFGKFKEDTKGAGIYQDESGKWHVEADYLKARNKIVAKSVEIEEAHHIGGQQMLTSASARIDYVVEREDVYRCYFLKRDTSGDTIYNKWMVGDQAYCKYFNVENTPTDNTSGIIQKYYWRKVVATSNETSDDNTTLVVGDSTIITSEYHFIDLSKTDCDSQSDIPQSADTIVQLGHQGSDKDRQNAIIMAGAGDGSPYIRQYVGINSFSLPEADTQIKPNDNVFTGKIVIKKGSTGLEDFDEWAAKQKEIDDTQQGVKDLSEDFEEQKNAANAAFVNLNTEIGNLNKSIQDINNQLDGVVENYFAEGAPTLDNYPASDWKTEEDKKNHIGDTYTDVSTTGETAGKSWRWLEEDSEHTGYHWHSIADTDALKALALAAEAKAAADGKVKTFVGTETPEPPYSIGDLWVRGDQYPIKYCVNEQPDGATYLESDWKIADNAQKYADAIKAELDKTISDTNDELNSVISDGLNRAKKYTDTNAAILQESIQKVDEAKANLSDVYTQAVADGKISEAEYRAIDKAEELANAAIQLYDETIKSLADGTITDEERKRIEGYEQVYNKLKQEAEDARQEAVNASNNASNAINIANAANALAERSQAIANESNTNAGQAVQKANELEVISNAANELASEANEYSRQAHEDAAKAKSDAESAKETADSAKETLTSWSADNVISPLEKQGVKDEYAWVVNDRKDIDNQVDKYELTTHNDYIAYKDAQGAYQADLETIIESNNDTVQIPSGMVTHQSEFYGSRTQILSLISEAAKKLSEDAQNAADLAKQTADDAKERAEQAEEEAKNYTDSAIGGLTISTQNLLRNSGFTGDYETANLQSKDTLKEVFEMFSPSLAHWQASNVEAQLSDLTQSGKEASFAPYGQLSQQIIFPVYLNEEYILSLYARGSATLTISFGGVASTMIVSGAWQRYVLRMKPTDANNNNLIIVTNNAVVIGDIMLEKGNIASEWALSVLDNRSELAKYESLSYIYDLLKVETIVGENDVSTGVVNTGLINMGHYEDGKRVKVTAGMSGTYNNDNSVAFFGGGDLEKAIYTVATYLDDPTHQPSEEELALKMAKAVITHGGRAILQDIILRGYVYAEGGVFRGTVYANDGKFRGTVEATDGVFNGTVNAIGGSFDGNIDLKGNITATGLGNARFNSISIDGRQRRIEITGPSEVKDEWGTPSENAEAQTYVSLGLGDIILVNGKPYVSANISFGNPYEQGASVGTNEFRFANTEYMQWLDGTSSEVTNKVIIDGTMSEFQGLIRATKLPKKSDYAKIPYGCIYTDGETLKIKT